MDNNQTFLNACRNGQKSIVQIFLKKGGIDINKRDQEGNTALYYACQKGYRDIVALLLDNDADASCINNRSESPLHAAARSGNKENPREAAPEGGRINVTDNEGRTPLICLLDNKRTDAALFLMDQGPIRRSPMPPAKGSTMPQPTGCGKWSPDSRAGMTGMHVATPRFIRPVYNGQGEIVRTLLLSDKSMLDSTNDGGETPLILACMQGNLVMVNLLPLGTGADPGKAMLSGNAPIHYAANFR